MPPTMPPDNLQSLPSGNLLVENQVMIVADEDRLESGRHAFGYVRQRSAVLLSQKTLILILF